MGRRLAKVRQIGGKRHKVLIGLCYYTHLHPKMAGLLSNMVMNSRHKINVWHQSGALVDHARNACRKKLAETKDDWLLFIDADSMFSDGVSSYPVPSGLDMLLRHGKPIVGALTVTRKPPCYPVIYKWIDRKDYRKGCSWIIDGIDKGDLVECDAMGAAFLLIHRDVFEKIDENSTVTFTRPNGLKIEHKEQPFDHIPGLGGEDWSFYWRAMEQGFQPFCDTEIPMGHIGERIFTINDWMAYKEAREEEGQSVLPPSEKRAAAK